MYICTSCEREFKAPAILKERHNNSHPPFESICVCPYCQSTDYEDKTIRYCRCCGAKLSTQKSDYCSEGCKSNGEKLWQREIDRKKLLTDSPLYKLVREIEIYNHTHKGRLSYGQYVSLFCRRKKKNEK